MLCLPLKFSRVFRIAKTIVFFYAFTTSVYGQIPGVGLELTIHGRIKITNWKYNSNIDYSRDSVYYSSAEKPDLIKKERLDGIFNRYLTILESSSKQLSNTTYLGPEGQIIIPGTEMSDIKKSIFDSLYPLALSNTYGNRVPEEGQEVFQDFFWPSDKLSEAKTAKIRSLLKAYVSENEYNQINKKPWQTLFNTLSKRRHSRAPSEKDESYALEDIIIYEYKDDTLKRVISYSKDWSVVQCDQFYYNVHGQLILFQRKLIGSFEETSLLFYYDEKGRIVNTSTLKKGYNSEEYHLPARFYSRYYTYDTHNTLKRIWTGDQENESIIVNKFILR